MHITAFHIYDLNLLFEQDFHFEEIDVCTNSRDHTTITEGSKFFLSKDFISPCSSTSVTILQQNELKYPTWQGRVIDEFFKTYVRLYRGEGNPFEP